MIIYFKLQSIKRFILFSFFLITTLNLFSQKIDTTYIDNGYIIQKLDKDGLRNGSYERYIEYIVDEGNGWTTSWDELVETGNFKNEKKTGKWESYRNLEEGQIIELEEKLSIHNSEIIRFSVEYEDGQKQGKAFYDAGRFDYKGNFMRFNLLCEGQYINGVRAEEWIVYALDAWSKKGEEIGKFYFENDEKVEPWEVNKNHQSTILLPYQTFLDSVLIKEKFANASYVQGYYLNGKRFGTWEFYSRKGLFEKSQEYDINGKAIRIKTKEPIEIVKLDPDFTDPNTIVFSKNKKYAIVLNEKAYANEWLYALYHTNPYQLMSSGRFELGIKKIGNFVDEITNDGKYLKITDYKEGKSPIAFFDIQNEEIVFEIPEKYVFDLISENIVLHPINNMTRKPINENFSISFWDDEVIEIENTRTGVIRTVDKEKLGLGTFGDPEGQITSNGRYLAIYNKKIINLYDFVLEKLIWTSPKQSSDEFALLDNNIIVCSSVVEKNKESHLHWYDFVKKKVLYSTDLQPWESIQFLYQLDNVLGIEVKNGYKLDTICQLDLSTGKYDFPSFNRNRKDYLFNVKEKVEDSIKSLFPIKYIYIKDKLLFGNWYDVYVNFYNHDGSVKDFTDTTMLNYTFYTDLGFKEHYLDEDVINYKDYYLYYLLNNKTTFQEIKRSGMLSAWQHPKEVLFWNGKESSKESRLVHMMYSSDNFPFFYSDDSYYFSNQNLSDILSFKRGNNIYSFSQFDLKYNRPDIILERIGYADPNLIKAYKNAYLKRLNRVGFTEDMLGDDFHVPEFSILNLTEIPRVTDSSSVNINLVLKDSLSNLDRVNVWVNNVPVNGTKGISVRDLDTSFVRTSIPVNLIDGRNKIEVSVLNQAGTESYKQAIEIERSSASSKPELYVVVISVSEYQQEEMNLKYAVKDGRDIARLFSNIDQSKWNAVHIDTLFNSYVKVDNVKAIKDRLMQSKINDQVILYISGHGLLDDDFNFYLASHEMDFSDPAKNGISYESLEGLLDGIPALKKLFMMDACHSGEVDSDNMVASVGSQSEENGSKGGIISYSYRGVFASANINRSKLDLNNSFELMKDLFVDLSRGSGAVVISAAAGDSYALESDAWNNGVFTYAILNGLSNMDADENKDGEIKVSELRNYVIEEVQELTKGRQKPTVRQENIEFDFVVWRKE